MRISDWGSDVCSSDLQGPLGGDRYGGRAVDPAHPGDRCRGLSHLPLPCPQERGGEDALRLVRQGSEKRTETLLFRRFDEVDSPPCDAYLTGFPRAGDRPDRKRVG